VSESESTSSAGRGTAVAHFIAPHWERIADRLAPVIDRSESRDAGAPGQSPAALLCVPDAGAAVELARALRALRPDIARILPVTDALRAARVLKTYGAPIVIATPADVERLLAASALPLDGVQAVALIAADELDAEQVAHVMASVPKEARRVLVAPESTPVVGLLLERYFHKAHRLADDDAVETTPAAVQYLCVRGVGAAAVPALLDELDPPSATIVTSHAESARAALAEHGYPPDARLVQISEGAAPANVALVVFAGLPTAQAFETAISAQPGRVIALIAPRQLSALRRLAGGGNVTPYMSRRATSVARAQEARLRGELTALLTESYPSREIVALEPLLAEWDGAELAGAALRLLENERNAAPKAAPAAAAAAPAKSERPARPERGERAPRARDEFPLKDPSAAKPRFVDRSIRRDRDERAPRRSFGDKPRSGFGDKPRGRFGDKPRSGFGDKPRGGFSDKRGTFRDKPRGSGPRKPRDDR
jgi:hypothetical protein